MHDLNLSLAVLRFSEPLVSVCVCVHTCTLVCVLDEGDRGRPMDPDIWKIVPEAVLL